MLYGACAARCSGGIAEDVARDMRLARCDHVTHETFVLTLGAPCAGRGHGRILPESGMGRRIDRLPSVAGSESHPGHFVSARVDEDVTHLFEHRDFVGGVYQGMAAFRKDPARPVRPFQAMFRELALGDVLENLNQVGTAVGGLPGERHGAVYPHQLPGLAQVALFDREMVAAAGEQIAPQCVLSVAVFRMRQVPRRQREQFLAAIPHHVAQPLVDGQEPALGSRVRDAHRHLLKRGLKPALGLLAAGDIVDHRDEIRGLPGRIAHQLNGNAAPAHIAVLAAVTLVTGKGGDFSRNCTAPELPPLRDILAHAHIIDIQAEELAFGIAQEIAQSGIDPQVASVQRELRDAYGRVLQRASESEVRKPVPPVEIGNCGARSLRAGSCGALASVRLAPSGTFSPARPAARYRSCGRHGLRIPVFRHFARRRENARRQSRPPFHQTAVASSRIVHTVTPAGTLKLAHHLEVRRDAPAERMQLIAAFEHRHHATARVPVGNCLQPGGDPGVI